MTGNINRLLFDEEIQYFCVTVFCNEEFSLEISFDLSEFDLPGFILCDVDHINWFEFNNEGINDGLYYIQRHYNTTCTEKLLHDIKRFLEKFQKIKIKNKHIKL